MRRVRLTKDRRFWDEQEWGDRKDEWHWHAYRRHMERRRRQAMHLASKVRASRRA